MAVITNAPVTDNRDHGWEMSTMRHIYYTLTLRHVHVLRFHSEDSQLTGAHTFHPLHLAAHRGEILKAVRRDQYDVLNAHPTHWLVAGQNLVVDKF